MCRETSGEATSVPPQVPPTRSPPPNSYRTCSTPTSESPLGCPLRTQTPQPSEAETDWEGGREKENHTEKSKGSRAKKPFLKPHSTRAFSFISFDHSVLFFFMYLHPPPFPPPCNPQGWAPSTCPHYMNPFISLQTLGFNLPSNQARTCMKFALLTLN